ncbi:MAG: T9SS type A sorting domain-containing protein [Ignavibacteriaceae bacterium]|nr:T9SS type A sorting domain-containing protein [Ignavibacteriaceae bacterium]
MKKYVLFFLFTGAVFAQWKALNPYPSGNTSYVGSAPSANRYITVTPQSEAFVTHDGGVTWEIVPLDGNGIYRSCYFINDNLGWAVGSFTERMHKTTNGGLSWQHLPGSPDTTKYDVYFISENIGWSVGFNGFIIKTTDGGVTWNTQSNTSITNKTLYGVTATDVNNVFVVGNTDVILKSSDGGVNWSLKPQIFSSATDYRSIYFPPTATGLTGFACGNNGRIIKTTDGGDTWQQNFAFGGSIQLWAVHFGDAATGLAVGSSSTVLRTTDGGTTWNQVTGFPASQIFYSVRFATPNIAYLSGGNGYIFKSTDAGATWNLCGYRFTSSRIKDVSFSDNNNGFVVSTAGFAAKSSDGGKTFSLLSTGVSFDLNEVKALSPSLAFVAGKEGKVINTTDGGATWNVLNTGLATNVELLGLDFISPTTGWAGGTNGLIVKTTDGGATWVQQSLPSATLIWDMDFVDANTGWAACSGEKVFRTTDGGTTWAEQLSIGGLGLYGISFIDSDFGITSGTSGNTYFTTNSGQQWTPATTKPGTSVWSVAYHRTINGTIALAACASGYVFKSTDGGANWTEEPRLTISTFDDIEFSDAANAWVCGNAGTLIKYYEPSNVPVELTSFSSSVTGGNVTLRWATGSEVNNRGFEVLRKSAFDYDYTAIHFVEGRGNSAAPSAYLYEDKNLPDGIYFYRLKQTDFDGTFNYYDLTESVEVTAQNRFTLYQNAPNPFRSSTKISYTIPREAVSGGKDEVDVTLSVFDVLGNHITDLLNGAQSPGTYEVSFPPEGNVSGESAKKLTSGIYIYRLTAGNNVLSRKMILVR